MQADTYRGISKLYQSEYKASGSKFYGYLFPIESADAFDLKIKEFKNEFSDATHVCSGCVIGIDREYQRFSDDGEPSNSSGRPILHAILSAEISYVGCAVVRYYGGKKLGIPGLIESYGGAAQLCIDDADIKELVLQESIVCEVRSDMAYRLYNFLARKKEVTYTTNDVGQFTIVSSKSVTSQLQKELQNIPTLVVLK
jgi:putative IMPACT (imprinted ancient) family translation regulator